MSALSRLRTAIQDDLLALPTGPVTVIGPDATFDIGALASHDVSIVTTVFPEADRWEASGFKVQQTIPKTSVSIVNVPRSKALARSLVAKAAANSDLIVVDGSKTDGIESIFKSCRKALGDLPSVAKAHGRIFWFPATSLLDEWSIDGPAQNKDGFFTTPGVFSEASIDKGSLQLVGALPLDLSGRVADLGAGWGYLSSHLATCDSIAELDLIEAENLSLECAKLNVKDPRANFIWADATNYTPSALYDHVVMNPPFHTGRDGDTGLGKRFIESAAKILKPNGTMWMVANRHLPYEETVSDCFQKVTPLEAYGGFKLFKASRPKR